MHPHAPLLLLCAGTLAAAIPQGIIASQDPEGDPALPRPKDSGVGGRRFHDEGELRVFKKESKQEGAPLAQARDIGDDQTFPGINPDSPNVVKSVEEKPSLDASLRIYLEEREAQQLPLLQAVTAAAWNYGADLSHANMLKQKKVNAKLMKLQKRLWKEHQHQGWSEKLKDVKDEFLKRRLQRIEDGKDTKLTVNETAKAEALQGQMVSTYSKARVNTSRGSLSLEPGIEELFATSRNATELRAAWVAFRAATGRTYRPAYVAYVALLNTDAKRNNFTDLSEVRVKPYEDEDFKAKMAELYEEVLPLYRLIHGYVRTRLFQKYGRPHMAPNGTIPAHLLGNMWAQTWGGLPDITAPFPAKRGPDIDAALKKQGYTPLKMFQLSDNFYQGLNLTAMPAQFWKKSIMEKPVGRDMVCHASAWDMYDGDDFRIKMCTEVSQEKLYVIHHEMGHVQYYLQYRHLPLAFREGANPGFHEAIGDTLALSVMTPGHLQKIGLVTDTQQGDKEAELNFLMDMALKKVVFLPYAYMLDTYRWDVFSGKIPSNKLNCEYWNKRRSIQGLHPPAPRSEEDFDAGAKYHVASDTAYIRYFVSHLLQFQLQAALCKEAGQYDPSDPTSDLHTCDLDRSAPAGNLLRRMLSLGSSLPWPEALRRITGSGELSASPLLRYFRPLQEWLTEQRAQGDGAGWEIPGTEPVDYCTQPEQ